MDGARFIQRLSVKNLLSFNQEGVDIELQPLNVLIGPNGSGKSNFIEAIGILRSAPQDFAPFRYVRGLQEWFWKDTEANTIHIDITLSYWSSLLTELSPLRACLMIQI